MDYVLVEPQSEEDFETYYRLRYERLRKPHGQPEGSERNDPLEEFSSHVVAKVGDRVVASGCWVVLPTREGLQSRYRQMAVDPDFEGMGIGSALMRYVEEQSRAAGATVMLGNVRAGNVAFFKRHGWIVKGKGVTLFDEVESVSMIKPLA